MERGDRERVTGELCEQIYAEMKTVDIPREIFLGVIKSIVDNIVDSEISGQVV